MSEHYRYGGLEILGAPEGEKPGVTIVGQYDPNGNVLKKPLTLGNAEDLSDLNARFKKSILIDGGEFLSPVQPMQASVAEPKKRGRKPKIKTPQPVAPLQKESTYDFQPIPIISNRSEIAEPAQEEYEEEEEIITQKRITFQNGLGRIRSEVEQVIHQDNDRCILLVFSNDDKVTFIPKEGEKLEFSENGKTFINIFFPDCLFDYNGKVLMVLFKIPDNIEEKDE